MQGNRALWVGLTLLIASFILSKLLLFALPMAADLGKMGRGVFREGFIALNLWLGYRCIPGANHKKQFLFVGLVLECVFLAAVAMYAWLLHPPALLMQVQVMFRELLLSPMYFFGFYMLQVRRT